MAPMEMKPSSIGRLGAIDALRGAVMVVMALDHVRDFVHRGAMSFSPTDLERTTPILFMTRWITHFCAPTFMLTAGLAAFLWWQHNHSRKELSVFLLTRGVWLVLLEVTVMRLAYFFNFSFQYPVLLLVLWALGACMVVLAALVWLPIPWLAGLSIAMIVLHNLLDPLQASSLGAVPGISAVIHQVGAFGVMGVVVVVGYPLVPWIGVMGAGFCLGRVFLIDAPTRQKVLIRMGVALTLAFVVVRGLNVYGDPVRWSAQKSGIYTALSFLNCTKYPPSLSFLLMTLGPALVALACFDRWPLKTTNPLIVLGRVPLFYFVVHFYAAHIVGLMLAWFRYGNAVRSFLFIPMPSAGGPAAAFPPDFGFDLWVVYAVWIGIVVGLYPACLWFAGVKARRRDWWLSYL
jgi:uncharacterized membrane protein